LRRLTSRGPLRWSHPVGRVVRLRRTAASLETGTRTDTAPTNRFLTVLIEGYHDLLTSQKMSFHKVIRIDRAETTGETSIPGGKWQIWRICARIACRVDLKPLVQRSCLILLFRRGLLGSRLFGSRFGWRLRTGMQDFVFRRRHQVGGLVEDKLFIM